MLKQTQVQEITQKATERTVRDLVICGVAGFFGGFGIGAPLSIGAYLMLRKLGIKGNLRWVAWGLIGCIALPTLVSNLSQNSSDSSSVKIDQQPQKVPVNQPPSLLVNKEIPVAKQTNQVMPEPTPLPPVEKVKQTSPVAFQEYLPSEDLELRSYIKRDSTVEGWMIVNYDIWIGRATREELLQRGFFINNGYKHSGSGFNPPYTTQGSCTFIGFSVSGQNDAYVCGKGVYSPKQWGVQVDATIQALDRLDNEWDREQAIMHSYKKKTD